MAIGGQSLFGAVNERIRLLAVVFSCSITLAPLQAKLGVAQGGSGGKSIFFTVLPEMPLGVDTFGCFAVGLEPQTQNTAGGQPQCLAPIPRVTVEPGDIVGLFISPTNVGEVLSDVSWVYEVVTDDE